MDFDDLRFINPSSLELERALLNVGRREYTEFYRRARLVDSTMMDALVLCRSTLRNGLNEPRDYMPPEFRLSFERVCNHTEQVFTTLREKVRTSVAFQSLNPDERSHIERTLFTVECSFR